MLLYTRLHRLAQLFENGTLPGVHVLDVTAKLATWYNPDSTAGNDRFLH